jgi:dienelactone hydrolase
MNGFTYVLLAMIAGAAVSAAESAQAPPSIEVFAARPRISGVAISPDGRYLSLLQAQNGKAAVVVVERQGGPARSMKVVMGEPDKFRIKWCNWATATRLLCAYQAILEDYGVVYSITRLVAVDADGGNMRVLLQNSDEVRGQFEDRVINWHPGPENTVLIEADEGIGTIDPGAASSGVVTIGRIGTPGAPAVFALDVMTGHLKPVQRARPPIFHWVTDSHGEVRLGWGFSGTTESYFARLEGDSKWQRLEKFEAFSRENHFTPIAIDAANPNKAYALGPSDGREALWLLDLTDVDPPRLLFSSSLADVSGPIIGYNGNLLGVGYETEFPQLEYVDVAARDAAAAVKKSVPGQFVAISSTSENEKVFVVSCWSDFDPLSYRVFDVDTKVITSIGAPYPEIKVESLGAMRPINYPARDGTSIPGYLTLPPGGATTHLPLIVMPHGGPIARDSWDYFFLRQFLASRGYAVLQMNFRGSDGYGSDWFFAAHQDWGGLTYDDVVDGARWAIAQGTADPARVCVVGWSFGGYIALLGAQRNSDIFHCAVSIAGVSDLGLLIDDGYRWWDRGDVMRKQIGTDSAKLRRDSPRLHAADFNVPVLILHGDQDPTVPRKQSQVMDAALTHASKSHRFLLVHGADHSFNEDSGRATLLREIENFLTSQIGKAPTPPEVKP